MILALDISTTCIGYSLFNKYGELIEIDCIKFNSKLDLFERLDLFKKKLEYLNGQDLKRIAIEEPLVKFKGKFSNANTIAKLNFFNGMISGHLATQFQITPTHYNVLTARSLAFPKEKKSSSKIVKAVDKESDDDKNIKQTIWQKVMEREPQINWRYSKVTGKLMDENFDMADSYVVGLADISTLGVEEKK